MARTAALAACLMVLLLATAAAAQTDPATEVVLSSDRCRVAFSTSDGSILWVRQASSEEAIVRGGKRGLWQIRFADGSVLSASDFGAQGHPDRRFALAQDRQRNALLLTYESSVATVRVDAQLRGADLGLRAQILPKQQVALDLWLPADLRFQPDSVARFIAPDDGLGVGMALKAPFFKPQSPEDPYTWTSVVAGPKHYAGLYGAVPSQRAVDDPPVELRLGAQAAAWLDERVWAQRLAAETAVVNRAPAAGQADVVLVGSPNGPYISAGHLGGKGLLWRVGGMLRLDQAAWVPELLSSVVDRLCAAAPAARAKVGVIALAHGPTAGSWSDVQVDRWLTQFGSTPAVRDGRATLVPLRTILQVQAALAGGDFVAILNPYGEQIPAPRAGGAADMVAAVGRYVRQGGNWFEVGGFPFHYELVPAPYLSRELTYPNAFADFLHLDSSTAGSSISIYGVQPQVHAPWAGAKSREAIFVPARLAWGGDADGGYCRRAFATYVPAGQNWSAPLVRLSIGSSAPQSLSNYAQANRFEKRLEQKMPRALLDRFRQSVLVLYHGSAAEQLAHLGRLPVPTLIHFANYLHGGFDKQYPDHLPPPPGYGSGADLRRFFREAQDAGHLIMPYTNPTWWCDHPRGPTFQQHGEAPLLKGLDGQPVYERYADNDGWTICFWHPAVRQANERTVRQFSQDYPVDVLFQDQVGARGWAYDTNPTSPTPYAYSDGLISQAMQDAAVRPLSTECGWDRVINYESQFCGLSWRLVPTTSAPDWVRFNSDLYPPGSWEIFPLAQYLAHDKLSMVHHDLGQFVTNRRVLSWTLGLGFGLSYSAHAPALDSDPAWHWLQWLGRVQKSVVARYVGEPLTAFAHEQPKGGESADGVLRAQYGAVKIVANLENRPLPEAEGRELAGYGFFATAPGMVAGDLRRVGAHDLGPQGVCFVAEGDSAKADLWVYGPVGQDLSVELPEGLSGDVTVAFDDQPSMNGALRDGVLRLTLPASADQQPALPDQAPQQWPGSKPAIGVLVLGPGIAPSFSQIAPEQWLALLRDAEPVRKLGLSVEPIRSADELCNALRAGRTRWFAIINPYGELFPVSGPDQWQAMLDDVRQYVRSGGNWWEVAGLPFCQAMWREDNAWKTQSIAGAGIARLGLRIEYGAMDQPPELLKVPAESSQWFSREMTDRISRSSSQVNRALGTEMHDPEHLVLVAGQQQSKPYIGGYRLSSGGGWLWRIGGFDPRADVAIPVVAEVTHHLYTHPPLPPTPSAPRYLWHATITAQ